MIHSVDIRGYKSLRQLRLELAGVTVIQGQNGTGKTSIYRALELLRTVANGNIARHVASQGGVQSLLWSGERHEKHEAKTIEIGVQFDRLRYSFCFGYPIPTPGGSWFDLDPIFKNERLEERAAKHPVLVERKENALTYRDARAAKQSLHMPYALSESMLEHMLGLRDRPEILEIKQLIENWRFYDEFDTRKDARLFAKEIGYYCPRLLETGENLAASLRTIYETGDWQGLSAAIDRAFADMHLELENNAGVMSVLVHQAGMRRPFALEELSAGTLQFILLAAALFSSRPAPLIVLNEPERSLHSSLYRPLCEMILDGSAHSQIIVVTHAEEIARYLSGPDTQSYQLEKINGQTMVI